MAYNQIGLTAPLAVAGMKATPDQSIYTPFNYLVGDAAGIPVGQFVAESATAGEATATIASAAAILGFVERVINSYDFNLKSAGTLTLAEGSLMTIAKKGDYYVAAPGAVTVGSAVYCSGTGAIVASGTTGALDTGWKYKTAGAASGDMVIISNW